MLKNDLLIRTLKKEQTERVPVWMMRQAGRYLPEYRAIKEKYGFFDRCQTPELASEITIQPVEIIGVDAAILFSDILVVPQAMGMEVQLIESKGPFLPNPIANKSDLDRIVVPDVNVSLDYVSKAISLTKEKLNDRVPLIGFAGAPWTLLCYMVEGKGSKTFDKAKAFCFQHPNLAEKLLQMITDTTINYLDSQIKAGVDAIQLFDSWGGLLSPDDFETFSLRYIRQIVQSISKKVPFILFAKGVWYALDEMKATGADALGLDWCIKPDIARKLAGKEIVLQGNFDPAMLLTTPSQINVAVRNMINSFGKNNYIANLGHGILPNVPVENAKAFVDAVKEYGVKIKMQSQDE